jgi:hypothetical protein
MIRLQARRKPKPTRGGDQASGRLAQTLSEHKADGVKERRAAGRSVCFSGDGINDAMALKSAQVSIPLRVSMAVFYGGTAAGLAKISTAPAGAAPARHGGPAEPGGHAERTAQQAPLRPEDRGTARGPESVGDGGNGHIVAQRQQDQGCCPPATGFGCEGLGSAHGRSSESGGETVSAGRCCVKRTAGSAAYAGLSWARLAL